MENTPHPPSAYRVKKSNIVIKMAWPRRGNGDVLESFVGVLATWHISENVRTHPSTEIKAFTYGFLPISDMGFQEPSGFGGGGGGGRHDNAFVYLFIYSFIYLFVCLFKNS